MNTSFESSNCCDVFVCSSKLTKEHFVYSSLKILEIIFKSSLVHEFRKKKIQKRSFIKKNYHGRERSETTISINSFNMLIAHAFIYTTVVLLFLRPCEHYIVHSQLQKKSQFVIKYRSICDAVKHSKEMNALSL